MGSGKSVLQLCFVYELLSQFQRVGIRKALLVRHTWRECEVIAWCECCRFISVVVYFLAGIYSHSPHINSSTLQPFSLESLTIPLLVLILNPFQPAQSNLLHCLYLILRELPEFSFLIPRHSIQRLSSNIRSSTAFYTSLLCDFSELIFGIF